MFQDFLILKDDSGGREGGFVQTVRGSLNRNLSIPRRLIVESRVRTGTPSFSAAPPGQETRPGSPQEPTRSVSFPAGLTPHSVCDLRILELRRFHREPAIIHLKRVVLAQDCSPFNDILKLLGYCRANAEPALLPAQLFFGSRLASGAFRSSITRLRSPGGIERAWRVRFGSFAVMIACAASISLCHSAWRNTSQCST